MTNTRTFSRRTVLSGLTLSFILFFATTTLAKNAYVSVLKDGTNIRTTPSAKGEVQGEVFAGFPLQILESKGEWAEVVDFEGDQGWINNALLSQKKSVIVKAKKVELREAPNGDPGNPVVVVAKYGVTFTPLESRGEWLMVRHEDGTEGWLKNDQVWPAKPFESSPGKPAAAATTKHKKPTATKAPTKKRPAKSKKGKRHHK